MAAECCREKDLHREWYSSSHMMQWMMKTIYARQTLCAVPLSAFFALQGQTGFCWLHSPQLASDPKKFCGEMGGYFAATYQAITGLQISWECSVRPDFRHFRARKGDSLVETIQAVTVCSTDGLSVSR